MSDKLNNYLTTMETELNSIQEALKTEKANPTTDNFLSWFLNNNDIAKKYITNLSLGANLDNDEDNETAYKATFKKHVETMNTFYKLGYGSELFKKVD